MIVLRRLLAGLINKPKFRKSDLLEFIALNRSAGRFHTVKLIWCLKSQLIVLSL